MVFLVSGVLFCPRPCRIALPPHRLVVPRQAASLRWSSALSQSVLRQSHGSANLRGLAIQRAEHDSLSHRSMSANHFLTSSCMHVPSFPADESFIRFDMAGHLVNGAAKRGSQKSPFPIPTGARFTRTAGRPSSYPGMLNSMPTRYIAGTPSFIHQSFWKRR